MLSNITIGDKYGPAMEIFTKEEADAYLEQCVEHCMAFEHSVDEAREIERTNLGYFAGYYSAETRKRVEVLFGAVHPHLGEVGTSTMSIEDIIELGKKLGARLLDPSTTP